MDETEIIYREQLEIDYKSLKKKLDSLHRKQWDKKKQLKKVILDLARIQRSLNRNKIVSPPGRAGDTYVPWHDVKHLHNGYQAISKIQKQMNLNRRNIKIIQGYIDYLTETRDLDQTLNEVEIIK